MENSERQKNGFCSWEREGGKGGREEEGKDKKLINALSFVRPEEMGAPPVHLIASSNVRHLIWLISCMHAKFQGQARRKGCQTSSVFLIQNCFSAFFTFKLEQG